jgi:hypothetical protein
VDISNAFLSIGLTERAKRYLAIITPFGVYIPQRTPFGLKTSPSAFCRALDIAIGDLPFLSSYMDDIIVGGLDDEDLMNNLITLFKRLVKYNLKIQLDKTLYFETEVKILGVIFNSVGKKIDPNKITAIT